MTATLWFVNVRQGISILAEESKEHIYWMMDLIKEAALVWIVYLASLYCGTYWLELERNALHVNVYMSHVPVFWFRYAKTFLSLRLQLSQNICTKAVHEQWMYCTRFYISVLTGNCRECFENHNFRFYNCMGCESRLCMFGKTVGVRHRVTVSYWAFSIIIKSWLKESQAAWFGFDKLLKNFILRYFVRRLYILSVQWNGF